MLRLRKAKRSEFFTPLTLAWWIATTLLLGAILLGFKLGQAHGTWLPVCLTRRVFDLPCPLCGGTRAAMRLFSGDPVGAFWINPLASLAIPAFAVWTILWLGFGRRLETTLKPAQVTAMILLTLAINWAYLLAHPP
jgi:hypothetical protein